MRPACLFTVQLAKQTPGGVRVLGKSHSAHLHTVSEFARWAPFYRLYSLSRQADGLSAPAATPAPTKTIGPTHTVPHRRL